MARRSTKQKGKQNKANRQWRRIDLHIHTPGSNDYQEEGVTYLDILRQAVMRGLDVIAITDHNSVAGFAAMKKEIEQLFWLEDLGRIEPDEQRRLDEYRRLFDKILVLPGFEFTATFGFHILGVFPPETDVSFLEHLLLTLEVPAELLHEGSSAVGATSDVLKAYRVINEAGGLVIAAHANSKNGVAMRGLDFGGQTRIAYTQDPNLHVLEVTDLEKRGRYTTRRFFDGSKPEYSRAMRCIQGSDAHRLTRESNSNKNLGIGDRVTEVLLEETSFKELTAVLKGKDFSLTRPYRGPATPVDFVQLAREEGESIVQSFHESTAQRGGHQDRILRDVCAMANTNGGTIYLGVSDDPANQPVGVRDADGVIERIYTAISNRFSPEPDVQIDSLSSQGKKIVRLTVQPGNNIPYAIDHNHFYVRDEAETSLAVREEIVRLVERGLLQRDQDLIETPVVTKQESKPTSSGSNDNNGRNKSTIEPPRTGVEVVSSEKRKGTIYHTLRDLRNGNLITNVSKSSARKLWHYAITQAESGLNPEGLRWYNDMAVLNVRQKGDNVWYDLALRDDNQIHLYYGVTDSGLNDDWLALVGESA
ncbi:MAG: putative DNA binding domain-containing protein [Anaerolineales bacterium]|nr:putative DNA binding domain-containing protein [Anaerolineales bacterium]